MGTPKENQIPVEEKINEAKGKDELNESNSYRVSAVCDNCGFGMKTGDTFVTIPMGKIAIDYLCRIKCRRCGCIGHIRKK